MITVWFRLVVVWVWMKMILNLPLVAAAHEQQHFPDVPFSLFSKFIEDNFASTVTLSTVLMLLFTVTENTDLLSLHFRQRCADQGQEKSTAATSWIRSLGRAVKKRIDEENASWLRESDLDAEESEQQTTIALGLKLDALARVLGLYPVKKSGKFKGKLKSVSHKRIQAVYTLCPNTPTCRKADCQKRALYQWTRQRDVPLVRMIKNFIVYDKTLVFSGHCKKCETMYYADHQRTPHGDEGQHARVYLNSAQYTKIGQNLWVDRAFSNAVLSGMYTFHASAAAYAEFWNNAFDINDIGKLSRRQVWQAFVQESIQLVASASNTDLTIMDHLPIDEVTKEAFNILGINGVIKSADQHSCSECTQKYRSTADRIGEANANEADIVGMEDRNIVIEEGREEANDDDEEEAAPVKMVVLDGIIMGHTHCAFDGCDADLGNARGGVYCPFHELSYGGLCHAANCENPNMAGTLACEQHQGKWRRHVMNHRCQVLGGYRRALRRPDETWPWMPQAPDQVQPHDEEPAVRSRDSFIAPRMYCVETICAPCGVVVAWTKFSKAESPTNILNFLGSVYPEKDQRPAYVCIDKACMVLRTCLNNARWEDWLETSRFIVDAYHYINHRATDEMCRTWCNPAPLNGSAPNLVTTERDAQGQLYYKRAFNTEACEQLNAWLGGFESILKRMTSGNFNWFLHTMLFYHTMQVLKKQSKRENEGESDGENNEDL
jgi:hypothetical protein